MKKIHFVMVAIIALLVLTTGCVTKKKCNAKYPCITEQKDIFVYKDSLILDTLYLLTPPDTFRIETPAPCDTFSIQAQTSKGKVKVSVNKKGILTVDCISKADSLVKVIAWKDKFISELKEKIVYETKIEYKMSGKNFLIAGFFVLLSFIIGLFLGFIK
jgi:hypothetical protein